MQHEKKCFRKASKTVLVRIIDIVVVVCLLFHHGANRENEENVTKLNGETK